MLVLLFETPIAFSWLGVRLSLVELPGTTRRPAGACRVAVASCIRGLWLGEVLLDTFVPGLVRALVKPEVPVVGGPP